MAHFAFTPRFGYTGLSSPAGSFHFGAALDRHTLQARKTTKKFSVRPKRRDRNL